MDASVDAGADARRDAPPPTCTERAVPPRPLGTCVGDAECGAEICRRAETEGEVAVMECGPGIGGGPGVSCTTAAECAHGLCAASGRCVVACTDDAACAEAQRCTQTWVHAGPDAMQRATVCVPRRALPAAVVPAFEPQGAADDWTLPAGFAFHVLEPACVERPAAVSLSVGDAVIWSGRPGDPNPLFARSGSPLCVQLPSGDAPTPSGALSLRFDRSAGGMRTSLPSGAGSVLDLDVFYLGGGGFAATGTRGPPELAAALGRLEEIFSAAGISVGDVRQHDITGTPRTRLQILEGERGDLPELAELFSLGAGLSEPGVSLFLVRDIDFQLAVSGGIPGPLGHPGIDNSGVAIAVDAIGADLGRVMAHEVAHHLGLFHPTEFDGTVFEGFADTPVCTDADGDGLLSATECVGAGSENLMFFSADATGTELSPSQRAQLRRAPILR